MTTPIPTPFDIIDPGPGPLVPSALAWLALVLGALAIVSVVVLRRRVPRARSLTATLHKLLDEMRAAAASVRTPQEIERVARLSRRIISPYLDREASGMSSKELHLLAANLEGHIDEQSRSLAEAIHLLAMIEEQAYAPSNSLAGNTSLSESLKRLVTSLENHVRRFRPA